MNEPLQAGSEPFRTTDKVLAMALAMAGCQFARFEDYGPAMNQYSPATCRDRKILPDKPVSKAEFERAVFRAFLARRPAGIVVYLIQRDALFAQCLKAWDAMPAELQAAKAAGRQPVWPEVPGEDVMRIMFLSRLQSKEFEALPWMQLPVLCMGETRTVETPIEREGPLAPGESPPVRSTTTGNDCMIWNWRASAEWRANAGLPPLDPEIRSYLAKTCPTK